MKQINYLNEIKKNIRYHFLKLFILVKIKIKFILTESLRYSLKLFKFIIPYKLIKNYIPYSIKIKIKVLLSNYPSFTKIVKYILFWLKTDKEMKSDYFILFYKFFIKKFFLPVLKILLSNSEVQKILHNELKQNHIVQFYLNKIKSDKDSNNFVNYKITNNKEFLINTNSDLSLDVDEIYNKMKFFSIYYNIQN
ncbi:hypothetical protein [Rickettsiella endosymbiont of Xylota segnis]|uniref:hypothetical protein n=1 Tax=Rickettsiella endosymbiont of Xylota segnis TaxID=3066238 RepID=UPI0030CB394E